MWGSIRNKNRKADGLVESPLQQHKSAAVEKKISLASGCAGLYHWVAPAERLFCQFAPISDKCLTYHWIQECPSMCAPLSNDEVGEALLFPLTVFSTVCWWQLFATDWQQQYIHATVCVRGFLYWLCGTICICCIYCIQLCTIISVLLQLMNIIYLKITVLLSKSP